MSALSLDHCLMVCCNGESGVFLRRAESVEIYTPEVMAAKRTADFTDAPFEAEMVIGDSGRCPSTWSGIPFYERKNGVAFRFAQEQGKSKQAPQRFYPAVAGAQHVGNIYWNAYFTTEFIAKQLALDLLTHGYPVSGEKEWIEEKTLRAWIDAEQRARQENENQPRLPFQLPRLDPRIRLFQEGAK